MRRIRVGRKAAVTRRSRVGWAVLHKTVEFKVGQQVAECQFRVGVKAAVSQRNLISLSVSQKAGVLRIG